MVDTRQPQTTMGSWSITWSFDCQILHWPVDPIGLYEKHLELSFNSKQPKLLALGSLRVAFRAFPTQGISAKHR